MSEVSLTGGECVELTDCPLCGSAVGEACSQLLHPERPAEWQHTARAAAAFAVKYRAVGEESKAKIWDAKVIKLVARETRRLKLFPS